MVAKRQSQGEGSGSGRGIQIPVQEPKRKHGDSKHAETIGAFTNSFKSLFSTDIGSRLEPLIRRVVREEVERTFLCRQNPRATLNQTGTSGSKPLQLQFINGLPDTFFTLSQITAEDNKPLEIALFDVTSQSIVCNGTLSSIKIEICVLNGEFGSDSCEDWTEEEFSANILRERDGKGSLLKGDRLISLRNGVGYITKAVFTDNSRWTRSRKFKLGARVVQPNCSEANIREGRSESFVVKDNRGELYKKHYPPSLDDDIWRLDKIAKDGKIHKRLSLYGIRTVKDLLQCHTTNPTSLCEKFGKIPKKSFEAITEHAKSCVIDDYKLYVYQHAAEQPVGLLFNSVYMLVGVTFDGKTYCSPDTLTPAEKHLIERVKLHAYRNVNNLKSFDETSPFSLLGSVACREAGQCSGPDQGLQLNFPTAHQDQLEALPDFGQPSTSTVYNQFNAASFAGLGEMPQYDCAGGELLTEMYNIEENYWPPIGSEFPVVPDSYPTWVPTGDGVNFDPCNGSEFGIHSSFHNPCTDMSRSGKTRAVWYKIRTALIWVISVRRKAAAKRMAKPFYYNS
ncbi:hypothetical protein L6164_034970 [Bauhinia variegata]|uniref:Uncharacterized protein n=1 Tax=Bauhinia variegata TaxID=167791 RepID=A0ACB9KW64_BAUVA|nr:hypothetical protein L6164_034970 [Bauhinia variegata]